MTHLNEAYIVGILVGLIVGLVISGICIYNAFDAINALEHKNKYIIWILKRHHEDLNESRTKQGLRPFIDTTTDLFH